MSNTARLQRLVLTPDCMNKMVDAVMLSLTATCETKEVADGRTTPLPEDTAEPDFATAPCLALNDD